MPGGDGTGPLGQGPATGRGLGPCGRGLARGRGFGRGQGRGFGRGFGFARDFGLNEPVELSKEEQKKILEAEKAAIDKRLKELE
ncbi:DUF5320 domain-containing protein [Candidatus Woesearchaeota archaeon]|nr:DUF5320 domain-containing protein [Candidatus Woesearchaeota archaeon]